MGLLAAVTQAPVGNKKSLYTYKNSPASADISLPLTLTECSSESEVCEVMTGLKLLGVSGLNFFLMARICRRARNAEETFR